MREQPARARQADRYLTYAAISIGVAGWREANGERDEAGGLRARAERYVELAEDLLSGRTEPCGAVWRSSGVEPCEADHDCRAQ